MPIALAACVRFIGSPGFFRLWVLRCLASFSWVFPTGGFLRGISSFLTSLLLECITFDSVLPIYPAICLLVRLGLVRVITPTLLSRAVAASGVGFCDRILFFLINLLTE